MFFRKTIVSLGGVWTCWGNMFASDQNRMPSNVRKQFRGETYVRPPNNLGASLMFALRTTIVCEPMSEANLFSNIGLILFFV